MQKITYICDKCGCESPHRMHTVEIVWMNKENYGRKKREYEGHMCEKCYENAFGD